MRKIQLRPRDCRVKVHLGLWRPTTVGSAEEAVEFGVDPLDDGAEVLLVFVEGVVVHVHDEELALIVL